MPLFLILLALPLAEIATFIIVGGWIGLWPTLGLVIGAGLVGGWLLRNEGLRTAREVRGAMDALSDPTLPMAHGALVLLAAALLILPGFLTDIAAILLLIAPVRRFLLSRLAIRVSAGRTRARDTHRPDIVDAEYYEIDTGPRPVSDERPRGQPPSGWTRH